MAQACLGPPLAHKGRPKNATIESMPRALKERQKNAWFT